MPDDNTHGTLWPGPLLRTPARRRPSGPVTADAWNGIAFLDSPANLHHPTPWHVRPDGWMGASVATHQGFTLATGRWLELRYRLYVHPGTARDARVESAWHDFAFPPRVTVGPASPA